MNKLIFEKKGTIQEYFNMLPFEHLGAALAAEKYPMRDYRKVQSITRYVSAKHKSNHPKVCGNEIVYESKSKLIKISFGSNNTDLYPWEWDNQTVGYIRVVCTLYTVLGKLVISSLIYQTVESFGPPVASGSVAKQFVSKLRTTGIYALVHRLGLRRSNYSRAVKFYMGVKPFNNSMEITDRAD